MNRTMFPLHVQRLPSNRNKLVILVVIHFTADCVCWRMCVLGEADPRSFFPNMGIDLDKSL